MSGTGPNARGLRSPNMVVAMAILAALIVLVACGGLIYYASVAVDRISVARESQLMDRAIQRSLARLQEDVASVAVWSDAYDFTARTYDPAWAQVNYGTYFFQYLHHDVSVVLDARDRPIYASVAGKAVEPTQLADFIAAVRPLAASARRRAEQKIVAKPGALAFDRVGAAEAAMRVGPRVFLASASTVVPEPEYAKRLLTTPDPLVISAKEVDASYLQALEKDFGLKRARLLPGATPARPVGVLRSADGRPLATIGWAPERPGIGVYRDALEPIIILGLVVGGAVSIVILRLRQMAAEVDAAREQAEAGNRAKAAFLANMSHEIRTPLNGVLGMAQVLDGYELGPEQRACVKVIRDSGTTLLGVLNDVLDLSKIEAGKLEITEGPFRLDELAAQVCATFAELAATKGIALKVEVEDAAAGPWTGDALRIRQVLSNLVSNGVKFTSSGSVTLRALARETGVRLSVIDTGIGIADEAVPRLFEKFSQADVSTTRLYGGTGLGLSICRELVTLMGGAIEVRSRIGEGADFSVTLPLSRATTELQCAPVFVQSSPPIGALRVLAAEDNPTNQLVLGALFGPLDIDLTMTSNGREAVEAFSRASFDLVLMDVQMPEMNGLDATRAIRQIEATGSRSRTPILALTANVLTHQLESYRSAGMDGHVAKPLDAAALYAALTAALPQAMSDEAA